MNKKSSLYRVGSFKRSLETGIATKQFEYLITRMNLSRRPPDKGGFFIVYHDP